MSAGPNAQARAARGPTVAERLEYAALVALVASLRPLPWRRRGALVAAVARTVGPWLPPARRATDQMRDRLPALPAPERRRALRALLDNFSRTILEYDAIRPLYAAAPGFTASGLEHLAAARAASDGRLVVATAHFGNWEALRAVSALHDAPLAIIYRKFNNPLFEAAARPLIVAHGAPAFHKGRRGAAGLMRHVATGGGALILVDQRMGGAPLLDFMGAPAETSLAAAQLALRAKASLITARASRRPDGFHVAFDPAIPPGAPAEMMQTVNDRIADWVRAEPGQWLWLHRRWRTRKLSKTARKGEATVPQATAAQGGDTT